MLQTLIFSFLTGLMGANGIPHFVKGITKETYPCLLGNAPIPNLIAGWLAFIITSLFAYLAHLTLYPLVAVCSCASGALLIGLFHAGPGAIGRRNNNRA